MTTAILSALPQEQAGLLQQLVAGQRTQHAGRTFWQGHLCNQPVVLALSGMGKVAAATTATALAAHFGVQRMLFTGVAGGIGPAVQVGDVVVAHDYVQHDMDASPLAPRWQVPGYPAVRLSCDASLSALLQQAAHSALAQTPQGTGQVHYGLVASGDQFVGSAAASHRLRTDLHSAGHPVLAVEMEGAAVAQVCHDYGLPFAAVRTISDRADDEAHGDFLRFVDTVASPLAQRIVLQWLYLLSNK
jgi:adenosylhomocysteine nucleosidase